jgi:phage shock protein E
VEPGREIVVYCRSGHRASVAREALLRRGYTHVVNGGGFEELNACTPNRP